jgi:hypothetical protein
MNEVLKTAVLTILRPLVRYLISQGWTYGALADTLKMVCVAETSQHYGKGGGGGAAPPPARTGGRGVNEF